MATHDLTNEYLELRASVIRKRNQKSSSNSNRGANSNSSTTNTTPTNGYRKLAAGGASHDLMLSVNDGNDTGNGINSNNGGYTDIEMNALGGSSGGGGGGSGSGSSNNKNSVVKKPDWVADVDIVENCIVEITQQMQELQSRHAQRISSVFGRDLNSMEQMIEQQTSIITEQFRIAERKLQTVGYATKRSGGQDATVGANVQRSLAKRLQELSVTFRQSQRRYLAEVQTQKSGGTIGGSSSKFSMIQLNNNNNNNNELGSGGNSSSNNPENATFFTTQQMAVVDDLTSMVQGRDEEIIKIAQSIEELGTIFKELAVLVIDQGTVLDRIDYNMEAVVDHTQTGLQQLEKAEQSQKNARPLRCIVCLSLTIFALLVILIIKHRPRRGWL